MSHWFATGRTAVVGYTRRGGVLLAAGAPVCPPGELPGVCDEFEAFARSRGCRVCYVCAGDRLQTLLQDCPGHSSVALGAQPVWDPRRWPEFLGRHASLRQQLNRARNKTVEVEAVDPAQGAADPEVHDVLRKWLDGRPMPPLHFLADSEILGAGATDRVMLLARRHGSVVAFLAASPIAARNGFLVELLARSHAAPNGTSELLIDSAMQRFGGENSAYLTLGLVALARAADPQIQANPCWLRGMMRFARAHANRFYHFRGLEHFRTKLSPDAWEPVYAISNEKRFTLRTLYAMGAAFSGIPPWRAIGIGAAKALGAEWQRGVQRLRRPSGPARLPDTSLATES